MVTDGLARSGTFFEQLAHSSLKRNIGDWNFPDGV